MSEEDEHIKRLQEIVATAHEPSLNNKVLAELALELGSIIVKTQRRIMWLTVIVAVLTAALLALPFIERALK